MMNQYSLKSLVIIALVCWKSFPFSVAFLFIAQCPLLGTPFPTNFKDVVKTIFKRLFRVYAHIYHSHFQKIVSLKEEAHLNTCFKHFILFTHVSHSFKLAYFYNLLFLLAVSSFFFNKTLSKQSIWWISLQIKKTAASYILVAISFLNVNNIFFSYFSKNKRKTRFFFFSLASGLLFDTCLSICFHNCFLELV